VVTELPVGVLTDVGAVLAGALLGCGIGKRIPEKLRMELNVLLGYCSISIGITSIMKVSTMAPVVFALLLGFAVGFALKLETRVTALIGRALNRFSHDGGGEFPMEQYITAVALFCASGFGIYGTFVEAMSGDASILLAKAALDMMTALIFAINLRFATALIPAPMLVSLLLMFCVGKWLVPFISEEMLQNFTACGGILTLAAGLRVSGIKSVAIMDMVPALVLVMPFTALWTMLWT